MADTPEAIRKAVRTYMAVGLILFAGTVLTVLVAECEFLDFGGHGFDTIDCLIGLAIALTKATFVALVFMHLNHEKKAVYWIFGGSFVFVAALYGLTAFAKSDPIHDPFFYGDQSKAPASLASPTNR